MNEEKFSKVEIRGTNDDNSLNGSHHLIVELMKAISKIDLDDCIITGFEARFDVIKNPDVTNVNISIDENELEKQSLTEFLEDHVNPTTYEWMDYYTLKVFIDNLLNRLFAIYGKKCVAAVLGVHESKLLNGDTVYRHDVNRILDTFGIKYAIKNIAQIGAPTGKYVVRRVEDE